MTHTNAAGLPPRLLALLPRGFFNPREPLIVARAPGRLDVMGGIADYSGGFASNGPRRATHCVLQPSGDDMVTSTVPRPPPPAWRPRSA